MGRRQDEYRRLPRLDARPGGLRGASNFDQAYKASRADCLSAFARALLAGSV